MPLSTWKPLFPLILLAILFLYEEWVTIPSCKIVPTSEVNDVVGWVEEENPEDLKVMMVSNLLLLGSEAGFFNLYFRDYYMSKFFRKSFHKLKPDMLLVLGDVSAKGWQLTKSKWVSVLHQFHQMLGPFLQLPFHVILGDRDIGDCSQLDVKSVSWRAGSFPGLDSAGCGAFEISNVSFVSLNAVALLCGNNKLRFSVEKVIETESTDLQVENDCFSKGMDDSGKYMEISNEFRWRERSIASGSGPVLILHFPLHQMVYGEGHTFENAPNLLCKSSNGLEGRRVVAAGPYELLHTVPPNATEYIFQALKPRIIFSAHTHEFYIHTHTDGTLEVTIPAMTWKVKDDPAFIIATFRSDREAVSISYCSLAKESHVLIAYATFMVLLLIMFLVENAPNLRCLRR